MKRRDLFAGFALAGLEAQAQSPAVPESLYIPKPRRDLDPPQRGKKTGPVVGRPGCVRRAVGTYFFTSALAFLATGSFAAL